MKPQHSLFIFVLISLVISTVFFSFKSEKSRDNDYDRKVNGMKYHIFVDQDGRVLGVRNVDLDEEMLEHYKRQNRK